MPLIPEKLRPRSDVRSAISSQFWEQAVHSPRSLDGQLWLLPCEPPALSLAAPSGLSRAQQLVAAHALGLPAVPSFDGAGGGGLVLDRALASAGGRGWWAALVGRVKAQRMHAAAGAPGGSALAAARDPGSYALAARARVALGCRLTLDAVAEAPSAAGIAARLRALRARAAAPPPRGGAPAPARARGGPPAAHARLRLALPGHDLTLTAGRGLLYGEAGGEWAPVPLAAAIDLASHDRGDGLQYRLGLHQTAAPPREPLGPGGGGAGAAAAPLRAALHAQGAVAVEGEAYVWRGGGARHHHGQQAPAAAAPGELDAAAAMEPPAGDDAAAPLPLFTGPLGGGEGAGEAAAAEPPPPPAAPPPPGALLPVTAGGVAAAVRGAAGAVAAARGATAWLGAEVRDGSLQRLAGRLPARRGRARRRPYNATLAAPHLKLNAAVGCLARVPLPPARGLPGFGAAAGGADDSPRPLAGFNGDAAPWLSGRAAPRFSSTSSLASRASASSALADAWAPYFRRTALRAFASASASLQLGRFTRPLLDHTSLTARADVGLCSAHVVGLSPDAALAGGGALGLLGGAAAGGAGAPGAGAHAPDAHRAFALEGRGTWHCLSLSAAQQVVGPLRARADARFALDPTYVPSDRGERSTLRGLAATAASVRPALLEVVWGLDVALPGGGGAARLAAWWSPRRREGMVELRLF